MLILIPAIEAHKTVVTLSIQRLRQQLTQPRFLIITPKASSYQCLRNDDVDVRDDGAYSCVDKAELRDLLSQAKKHQVGWYYQQLLKFSAVSKLEEEEVLLLDADTVLLSRMLNREGLFYTSKEWHPAYFEHFENLFGHGPVLLHSAITNFMRFEPAKLRRMLEEIESRHGGSWWQTIVQIANGISTETAFSEYETYANWCAARSPPHEEQLIRIFRRGDLLLRSGKGHESVIAKTEERHFDLVAFEQNHRAGILRRLGAWAVLQFGMHRW